MISSIGFKQFFDFLDAKTPKYIAHITPKGKALSIAIKEI